MKGTIITFLRNSWQNIKTTIAKIHITSAIQVVDEVSSVASTIEPTLEVIQKLETISPIPEPAKGDIAAVLAVSIPILKTLANKKEAENIYNDMRLALATEVANILSGKVHDWNTIKGDIQSVFDKEIEIITGK